MSPTVRSALLRSAVLVAGVTIVSRLLGFVRYLVFGASVGGGGAIGTTYTTMNQVPNLLFESLVGGGLAAAVVPVVSAAITRSGKDSADRTTSAMLSWALTILVPLGVLAALCAQPISGLLLGWNTDAPTEQIELGARLLRVFAVQIPLYGIAVVLGGYLNAHDRFLWPVLCPALSSVVVIASYRLYVVAVNTPEIGTLTAAAEFWLGWGTTFGVVALSLPLIIPAARLGLRFRPTLRFPEGRGPHAAALAGAGLSAVAAQQAALLAVMLFALQTGGNGTLPIFQYAQAVYLLPWAVLIAPLLTTTFPRLSRLHSAGRQEEFGRASAGVLRLTALVGAAGGAVLWAVGPAVDDFFRLIDRNAVEGVGAASAALGIGLLGWGLLSASVRVLNAAARPRDALAVGSAGWLVAALLVLVFAMLTAVQTPGGAATGFALAFAVGMTVGGVHGLSRAVPHLGSVAAAGDLWRTLVLVLPSSVAGAWVGWLITGALLPLAGGTVTTVLVALPGALACALLAVGPALLVDRSVLDVLRGGEETTEASAGAR